MSISGSVGRGGANRFSDAISIQGMLNETPMQGRTALLVIDGLVGPKTIACILQFQKQIAKTQDGRIDPNGPTLKALAGSNPDLPSVGAARAIIAICDSVITRLPAVGFPLNDQAPLRLRREIADCGRALRAHLPPSNVIGAGPNALIGFPLPVFPALPAAGVLLALQVLVMLMAATLLIMMLQAIAPSVGPAASKLALELEKRRAALSSALVIAALKLMAYIEDVKKVLDRCKPAQANLNTAGECKRAIDNALRILRNMEFKMDALRRLVFRKIGDSAAPDIQDIRNAKQLVEELMADFTDMKAAVRQVLSKCQCHFVIG